MNRTPGLYVLIGLNFIFVLLAQAMSSTLVPLLALYPPGEGFLPWQLITYAFLHASLAHFAFNMYGLWMFGRELEEGFGTGRFLLIYFASVLAAAATQLLVALVMGNGAPTIGASGGVFGILLTFAVCFPKRTIVLLIPPVPMPAWLFVALYGLLELFMGVTGTEAGVAHFAHLGGMIGAAIVLGLMPKRR